MIRSLVFPLFGLLFAAATRADAPAWRDANRDGVMQPYEDPAKTPSERTEDLLSRMTREEKLGQLNQRHLDADALSKWHDAIARGEVGSMLPAPAMASNSRLRNMVQRTACEKSRLGVPLILGFDTIHGFRTIFPTPIAQACSWDPSLVGRTSAIAARETSAAGIDWVFAPMCDVGRDPRWGRVAEGFGEDPLLISRFVAASVRGFQGETPGLPRNVISCLKHFVGYGAAEGGRDYNTVEISARTLRDVYLPPFREGVRAGARSVMSAFSSNNGIPATADRALLTGVLREEWGFDGFVVSDWTAVSELQAHGFAADAAECARFALNAGVDMEMLSTTYHDTLPAQLSAGVVSRGAVDEAARRVLRVKFERGLFDRPYVDEALLKDAFLLPDAVTLAREAVRRSCVLLKNEGGALPLDVSKIRRLAVVGPFVNAHDEMLGCWQAQGKVADVTTLADGLAEALGRDRVVVARGCPVSNGANTHTRTDGSVVVTGPAEAARRREIEEAVAVAKSADAVVLTLGEPRGWTGENATRVTLDVTGAQKELFEEIANTGKPVVVVLFGGRPLSTPVVHARAAAVLMAWNPGVQAGPGLADVLTGAAEPTGRLPCTWPRSVGQCPIYYNHATTGRPTYNPCRDSSREPLYPFGYGLGYSVVKVGRTLLSERAVSASGEIVAKAVFTNTGARPTETLAQLYIRCMADAAGVRPERELRDFRHVKLAPGESAEVSFRIPAPEFARLGETTPARGVHRVWVSSDAQSGEYAEVMIERK